MRHCHFMTITEGQYKGYFGEEPEYECFASFGPLTGNTNAAAAVFLSNEAGRLGIDCNEAGWTLALAMECYEKGLLTASDMDGIELTWGNYQAVNEMLHKIARREGFGNVLAEGAMRTAQKIGSEAPKFATHTMKGNTPRGHDHSSRWPMLFDTCLSQMSTDEGYSMLRPADLGLSVAPNLNTNNSPEDTVDWNARCKGAVQFEDCLGVCRFVTRTDLKLLAEAISAATGWDFSPLEALTVGQHIVHLLRAFNIQDCA